MSWALQLTVIEDPGLPPPGNQNTLLQKLVWDQDIGYGSKIVKPLNAAQIPFSSNFTSFGLYNTLLQKLVWDQDIATERRFVKPLNAAEIQFTGFVPIGGRATLEPNSTLYSNFIKRLDVRIASLFTFPPTGNYNTLALDKTPGWKRDLDTRTVKPINPAEVPFSGYFPNTPPPVIVYKQGWFRDVDRWLDNPFPVSAQQFASYYPHPPFPTPYLGWYGFQYDYRFATLYPVQLQRAWETFPASGSFPSGAIPRGGEAPWIDYHFTQPFNIQEQQFTSWPAEQVPQFFPPGSGRRYHPPTDYLPEPPDGGPNKPLQRPVWDKPEAASEPSPKIEPKTVGPPPLPPVAIFRDTAPVHVMSPEGLPTFQEYTPRNPLELRDELERARQEKDAVAALRVLGLFRGQ